MITIKDIADALSMSHSTVSRALNNHKAINEQTRIKVQETAARMGYIPNSGARMMRGLSSRLVGLIVPNVQNEFFSALARVLSNNCALYGYSMMLGISEDDPVREQEQIEALVQSRALGVMIAPSERSTVATRRLLKAIPCVQLLRYEPQLGGLAVRVNEERAIHTATDHLAAQGHRQIGYIGTLETTSTGASRLAGFRAACRDHGGEVDSALIRLGPPSPEYGSQAVHELLSMRPDLTGLVIGSPRQMSGALLALRERGVAIPKQVSIVGYGDTEWFQVATVPLTAMALPVRDMSEQATALLFSAIGNQAGATTSFPHKELIFEATLVARHSTAMPSVDIAVKT
ncbi:LacI family DNA-binding transcriptional regulator [Paraburkholderia sp. BL25I1N1]|uniref:LacI family DNA-binding transcriptional regulator n=1 Tax=Paraburkholderia sp. BL25I1N1 TaxID=1938804 RepID=UPI000D430EE9|nr:LacI family DNA-binding transcriptional regulator [Paraburkholderia sp. BL25I1N1]PRX96436.1 LacI family transcriptional regulator [Paraburkholderia sp. BL25I1N1]